MVTIITVLFVLVYQIFTIWHCRTIKLKARDLAICGMVAALTIVFSFAVRIPLPTGSTVTPLAALPIMLLAVVYDEKLAMLCGWITGILVIFLLPSWQPVHPAQVLVEHLVCLSCLGYAGIFKTGNKLKILGAMAIALSIKVMGHLLSGVIFFYIYAPEGMSPWVYSLTYNLSSSIPETGIAIAIMLVLPLNSIKKSLQGISNQ